MTCLLKIQSFVFKQNYSVWKHINPNRISWSFHCKAMWWLCMESSGTQQHMDRAVGRGHFMTAGNWELWVILSVLCTQLRPSFIFSSDIILNLENTRFTSVKKSINSRAPSSRKFKLIWWALLKVCASNFTTRFLSEVRVQYWLKFQRSS